MIIGTIRLQTTELDEANMIARQIETLGLVPVVTYTGKATTIKNEPLDLVEASVCADSLHYQHFTVKLDGQRRIVWHALRLSDRLFTITAERHPGASFMRAEWNTPQTGDILIAAQDAEEIGPIIHKRQHRTHSALTVKITDTGAEETLSISKGNHSFILRPAL